MAAARSAWSAPSVPAARCRYFWPKTVLPRSRPIDWGLVARVVPAAELKAETRKFAERLAQNPPAAIAGTKSLVYQAAVTPTRQQLDAEEEKIIDAMLTDDFRVAVKKFTSKVRSELIRRSCERRDPYRVVLSIEADGTLPKHDRAYGPCVRRRRVLTPIPCPARA